MIKKIILIILGVFDFFYQRKIIRFFKDKNIHEFNCVLDIGAHKGETIQLLLKHFKINKIISFEASPKNFEFLKKTKKKLDKKYSKTDLIIENIALGSNEEQVTFKQFRESSSSTISNIDEGSSYYKKKFKLLNFFGKTNNFEIINLNTQKLINYINQKKIYQIDFLKIDTEGFEFEILKGLEDRIKLVKIIMFEHHYDNMIKKNYTFSDINAHLKNNNFKKVLKLKMPFRKTFEYFYFKDDPN